MDRIDQYVDNIFHSFKSGHDTDAAKQVVKTKMQERYDSLVHNGSSENEAFGIVVSSFGSIEAIKDEFLAEVDFSQDRKLALPKNQKKRIKDISGLIMMLCTLAFFILGVFFGKWHPAWALFPIGGILCGIINNLTGK